MSQVYLTPEVCPHTVGISLLMKLVVNIGLWKEVHVYSENYDFVICCKEQQP